MPEIDRVLYVSDEILEEFNAGYVSCFFELIIDKESILCLDGAK
ncbi:MAG: hypothetical protein ACTS73_01085 [Arsenophonus sp. NEOnobi-MAG3]